jgi:hypothetical protein
MSPEERAARRLSFEVFFTEENEGNEKKDRSVHNKDTKVTKTDFKQKVARFRVLLRVC